VSQPAGPAAAPTRICVLGLGYIGLPTASVFATHELEVLGVDIDPFVVETVNKGRIHIEEPGLKTIVKAATLSGFLRAALEPAPADVFIIAVPTPCVDLADGRGADMRAVEAATEALCGVLAPGNLVILESTSPPGTTRDIGRRITERTGLVPGRDVFVAHCPERVLPGQILHELIHNDRVIGGLTPACAARAASLYRTFVAGRCEETDAMTAELVKLMENTYRDVNIALANELAAVCEDLGSDARAVIRLANLHPRVQLHAPGPGVLGGLEGRAVAVFGLAYKANVDDCRESPSLEILELLEHAGARVSAYDPHVRQLDEGEVVGLNQALAGAEAIVVATGHDEFRFLDPAVVAESVAQRRVFDLCGVLDAARWRDAGFEVWRAGEPEAATTPPPRP
jgi:UDP-N-acetyl-D-mannosaminuronic acid dehydrogenase